MHQKKEPSTSRKNNGTPHHPIDRFAGSSQCLSCISRRIQDTSSPNVCRSAHSPTHRFQHSAWKEDTNTDALLPEQHVMLHLGTAISKPSHHSVYLHFPSQTQRILEGMQSPKNVMALSWLYAKTMHQMNEKRLIHPRKHLILKRDSFLHGGCRGFESLIAHFSQRREKSRNRISSRVISTRAPVFCPHSAHVLFVFCRKVHVIAKSPKPNGPGGFSYTRENREKSWFTCPCRTRAGEYRSNRS